jgi:hypothetical protein
MRQHTTPRNVVPSLVWWLIALVSAIIAVGGSRAGW